MNTELFYFDSKEEGKRGTLVLLHGNNASHEYFENQINFFKDEYRVIAPDTRGHGKSPIGKEPFTLEQFAGDLKDLLDELLVGKVTILGFSDGGNIALIFAMRYPEYVDKLIICGANISPDGLDDDFLCKSKKEYTRRKSGGYFSKKSRKAAKMLSIMIFEPDIKPAQLSVLSMPVLVIAGDHDLIKDEHTRLIAENIKHSTLCILAGTHNVMTESPIEFNNTVETWMLSQKKGQ